MYIPGREWSRMRYVNSGCDAATTIDPAASETRIEECAVLVGWRSVEQPSLRSKPVRSS